MNKLLCTWRYVPIHTSMTTPKRFGHFYCAIIREIQRSQFILNTTKMVRCNVIYAAFHTTRTCGSSCVRHVVKTHVVYLFTGTKIFEVTLNVLGTCSDY